MTAAERLRDTLREDGWTEGSLAMGQLDDALAEAAAGPPASAERLVDARELERKTAALERLMPFVDDFGREVEEPEFAAAMDEARAALPEAAVQEPRVRQRLHATMQDGTADRVAQPPPASVEAVWAHVVREPETEEPALLTDEELAAVNAAMYDLTRNYSLSPMAIRPALSASVEAEGLDVDDAFYKGGKWHRRTVELLRMLVAATNVQRHPCHHDGIGLPGCVVCDPAIRDALGVGQQESHPSLLEQREGTGAGG